MKSVIVSAAGGGDFHRLQGLILSLKDYPASRDLPVTVLDLGLAEAQRAWLEERRVALRPAGLAPLPPRADGLPAVSAAERLRPSLPALVPGFELYLWMDPGLWVQQEGMVPMYLKGGATGLMAITPQVHVSYADTYGARPLQARFKTYERLFDRKVAELLAPNPTISAGCFALKAGAPHWALWDKALTAVLAKDNFAGAGELALNYVLYGFGAEARSLFLPATANWICAQSLPLIDSRTRRLCEPVPPFLPIGILNPPPGAGETELRVTDGGRQKRSLSYRAGSY